MSGVLASVLTVALLLTASPGLASAQALPEVEAYLDGQSIRPAGVSNHFCHDFGFPRIDCYSTANALEAALGRDLRLTTATVGALSAGAADSVDYVTVYADALYGGTYMHLSQNYSALAIIGWNDRISSLKVRNSQSGKFWHDWFEGGTSYSFCCNSNVPSLGSHDDQFSSVRRNS